MDSIRKTPYIIAMVPAKLGSTRFPMKNLALLQGRPLVYYAIEAARRSGIFSRIIINAEDGIFKNIAKRYHVDFYQRPAGIVGPNVKTDTVVYDFLLKNPCDILAWVSPIAPLQPAREVREIVEEFLKRKLDSLMTVNNEQTHCVYKGRPINFNFEEIFAQTQDLTSVESFVYSLMMWRSKAFTRTFERKGYALICGKIGFYPVSKPSSVIIKRKEDLLLAQNLLKAMRFQKNYKVKYDKIVNKFFKGALTHG